MADRATRPHRHEPRCRELSTGCCDDTRTGRSVTRGLDKRCSHMPRLRTPRYSADIRPVTLRPLVRVVSVVRAISIIGVASIIASGLSLGLSATPARADHAVTLAEAAAATELSPDEFLAVFDHAELPGLGEIGPAPAITGDMELDARIRTIGESRGYRRHPLPNRPLVSVGSNQLQPEAAAGWASLEAAAADAGFYIKIRSAYRSYASQVSIFRQVSGDNSYAAINNALGIAALPGYSKHHTGYAIDVSDGDSNFLRFGDTAAYAWIAADNFANAKAHGWIPSYPSGSGPAGPNPEPWEFVWVGITNIICGDFEPTPEHRFCDTRGSVFAADIDWLLAEAITTGCRPNRFCGDEVLTRGQAATFLWRYAGKPAAKIEFPFLDVAPGAYYFHAARWLFSEGLTTGTSQTTFDPGRLISWAEFATFLWRMASRPEPSARIPPFADVTPSNFAAKAITWSAETGITTLAANSAGSTTQGGALPRFSATATTTRGQAAAFIHRFATHQNQPNDATENVAISDI